MSFNLYQQKLIDNLLATDFKKQYELIPEEFKQNYFFQSFLFQMADIYNMISIAKKYDVLEKSGMYLKTSDMEDGMNTTVEYTLLDAEHYDKNKMSVSLKKDGALYFHWTFAFVRGEEYLPERDDVIYQLAMRLSEDKTKTFVEHSVIANDYKPMSCHLSSVFEDGSNEVYRVAEAIDTKSNKVLFHEEFVPVGNVDKNDLNKWQKLGEENPISLLSLCGDSLNLHQVFNHQENIKEVYAGKCATCDTTRYAIFWKPDCFQDEAYQASFESISPFGTSDSHLVYALDIEKKSWVVELSEEEYQNLVGNDNCEQVPQLRKILK